MNRAVRRRFVLLARQDLPVTAYHEAGHAVASWAMQRALGWHRCQFDRVFIRKPEDTLKPYIDSRGRKTNCDGMVEGSPRYNALGSNWATMEIGGIDPETGEDRPVSPEERAECIARQRTNMEADVIELLAGPFAEARYTGRTIAAVMKAGGAGDLKIIDRKAGEFAECEGFAEMMADLFKRGELLIQRPDVWAAVQALAAALLDRWTIEAEEAVEIIDKAAGWQPLGGS